MRRIEALTHLVGLTEHDPLVVTCAASGIMTPRGSTTRRMLMP